MNFVVNTETVFQCLQQKQKGGGGGGGGEYERSRQEKEARVRWVIRQIQIGVVV